MKPRDLKILDEMEASVVRDGTKLLREIETTPVYLENVEDALRLRNAARRLGNQAEIKLPSETFFTKHPEASRDMLEVEFKKSEAKIAELTSEISQQQSRLAKIYRLTDMLFTMVCANTSTDREEFIKKFRAIGRGKWTWTPAEMLRVVAKRGKEAIELLGQPGTCEKVFVDRVLADDLVGSQGPIERSNPQWPRGSRRAEPVSTDEVFENAAELVAGAAETSNLCLAAAVNLHMAARWAACGFNQFQVLPDLAAGLILTESATTQDDGEVRLPFETFVLSLPERVVPFFVPDAADKSKQQWADTLWVHGFETSDGTRVLQIVVVWHGTALIDRTLRSDAEIFGRASDRTSDRTSTSRRSGVPAPFNLDRTNDDTEEIIDDWDPAPIAEDRVTLDVAWRLLGNFLSWLDASGGTRSSKPEDVPKKLREKRERGGETWPTQWCFGRDVVLGQELRRAAAEVAVGRSARHRVDGWHVRTRFIVRGHWRNQAHGPGRTLRTQKWIQPFWKGPEGAAAWSHLYTDKT